MATLEELKAENKRLRAIGEVKKDFREREMARKKLAKENFALRNPRKVAVAKKVFGGAGKAASGIGKTIQKQGRQVYEKQKAIARAEAARRPKVKKGKKQLKMQPVSGLRDLL